MYQVGKNALRHQDASEAMKVFKKEQAFMPSAYQYAKLLMRSGESEKALSIIKLGLAKSPFSLKFLSLKYHLLSDVGNSAEALAVARKLRQSHHILPLDFNTNYVEPFSNRIGFNKKFAEYNSLLSLQDMDLLANKLKSMRTIIQDVNVPQRANVFLSIMEVALQQQEPQTILEVVSQLRTLGVNSADILQMEGAAYAMMGQMDTATDLWLRAAEMSPNVPLHHLLASSLKNKGDQDQRHYHEAQAALLSAKMSFWENNLEPAREFARTAIRISPELPQAWFYLGEIESSLGNSQEARRAYQECLKWNPNHGKALLLTGCIPRFVVLGGLFSVGVGADLGFGPAGPEGVEGVAVAD